MYGSAEEISSAPPNALPPLIPTPRLLLRPWQVADYAPFAALNADPRVMAHFPAPLTRAESDALADRCATHLTERGWGIWVVAPQGSSQMVGIVGLHVPTAPLPFAPCVEVLWRLAHPAWGQGWATEAARAVLDVAFNQLHLPEVVSYTASSNVRSQAVMQRLGMERMGTFEHPLLAEGSPLRRHVWYRVGAGQALSAIGRK